MKYFKIQSNCHLSEDLGRNMPANWVFPKMGPGGRTIPTDSGPLAPETVLPGGEPGGDGIPFSQPGDP